MGRDQLRPTPGVRALDAGHRKQDRRLRPCPLSAGYWRIIGARPLERTGHETHPHGVYAYILRRVRAQNQSFGVTTLTSLPGTWMTRIGARPER